MNKQQQELIHFAQSAQGLDDHAKLKLILFAAGAKPATFITLKINPKNLDEKEHLERYLRACKIPFSVGRPRAYEEIVGITGNAVRWKIKGSWYGYDVFKDKRSQRLFTKYVGLLKRQRHAEADRVSGMLYDYPRCCVTHYIKEHSLAFLQKNYTHYTYYKHLHDIERAFPLVMHTACSVRCVASKKMNSAYAAALKKHAPQFWKRFSAIKKHKIDVIVDAESELTRDVVYGIRDLRSVFPVMDGHEYILITLKPINTHHYLASHLTKQRLERGTIFPAHITMQFLTADIKLGRPKRIIKNLHHERHFVIP